MTLKKLKKKGVVVLFSLSLLSCTPVYAGNIPVIDNQNIAQQLKTYTETLNIVKNTAEQIQLQVKELTALPQQVLDKYKTAFDKSVSNVKEILASADFFSEPEKWDKFWTETYPRITGDDYKQTVLQERSINQTIEEIMSMRNKEDTERYHELMQELELSKKRLQDLLEQNKTAVGNKQVTQIANQIAAEKAHIDSINTSIQAITSQNKVMQQQAEVLKAINKRAVQEAGAKAESAAIQKMIDNTTMKAPIF